MRAVRFPLNLYVTAQEKAWAEDDMRVRGLKNLPFNEVMAQARAIYAAFEERLRASAGGFFFGREPTSVDAYLFGHLAEAMTDLHFSSILPSYTNLMSFFRMIHTRYFAPSDDQPAFLSRINHVNACNKFNQVEGALLCTESHYVPESVAETYFGKALSFSVEGRESHEAKTRPQTDEEKERQRHNKLWLSIVGGVTAFFFVIEGLASLVLVNAAQAGDDDTE